MRNALYASAAAIALAAFGTTAAFAQSRDTIQVAGSSTVLPFASIVAEEFGAVFPEFKTPVVGSGGTGGGFSQFCQGVGDNTIDIANASRAIKDSELETCKANGVADVQDCPNVLVDTSGSQPEQGIVEWAVAQLGAERLVYGSDVVGRDFGTQIGRVLGARLTARQRDLILGGNACRLLRLEATR